jgi:xanthine dehydrogenase accessory factor
VTKRLSEPSSIIQQSITWLDQGYGIALVVVVNTWGSSPCPVGSQMVINDRGEFAGSVSGGCIEPFVISEAIDIIESGDSRCLEYGVSDEQAREVRLTCGGSIRVFVERAPARSELQRMKGNKPVTRVLDLSSGATLQLDDQGFTGELKLSESRLSEVICLHKQGTNGSILGQDNPELFVMTHRKPKDLVIVGAGHISQNLAPMATAIGFKVTIIDSRPVFAAPERFPGITILHKRSEQAMEGLRLTCRTAVAILAHDPAIDDPILHAALVSPAYYIGCLGSRQTHGKRLDRLREKGYQEESFKRLHAPIGLDIGGRSSAEIAVSILAEIIAVENKTGPEWA